MVGVPRGRVAAFTVAALVSATLSLVVAPAASAHEGRAQGDLEMVVGFGVEPAYVGQPNSVQITLTHDGEPVTDLGDSLAVAVSFGDEQPLELALEPYFEVGGFGTPGDYRAWFIPTAAGSYTFAFTGTVDGEDVDQTFTSGPDTFGDVESGSDIQYPVPQPAASDLVERIERESSRVAAATARIEAADTAAAHGAGDASSARTLPIAGGGVGVLGVAAAGTAVFVARRSRAAR